MDVSAIASDLVAEQDALDDVVAALDSNDWNAPTPSPRWTIRHQIAHLTYFDEAALLAITDPDAFMAHAGELGVALAGGEEAVDEATIGPMLGLAPDELLGRWRLARAGLADASMRLDDDIRIPWYGPAMGAKSFLTARLMETWAHGQDVMDALGLHRQPTNRLRHIADLGHRTRAWSYLNRGEAPPTDEIRVELVGPDGDTWVFGSDAAVETVRGPAEEFCLVVTQRRHLDDTSLVASPGAREWLLIAQAFAGPPTSGPEKGARP